MTTKQELASEHIENGDVRSSPNPYKVTHQRMGIGEYIATRFTTLKPASNKFENPITILRLLNKSQWLFFTAGFLAWMWDGMFPFLHLRS